MSPLAGTLFEIALAGSKAGLDLAGLSLGTLHKGPKQLLT